MSDDGGIGSKETSSLETGGCPAHHLGSRQNSSSLPQGLGSRMVSQISSEYCYEYSQEGHSSDDMDAYVQHVDVNAQLKEDIGRSRAYLGGVPGIVITDTIEGSMMWVTVSFRVDNIISTMTAKAWGFDATQPISLRIELNPATYTSAELPPTFKVSQNGEPFLLGQQMVRLLTAYIRRCWNVRRGFTAPAAASTLGAALSAGLSNPLLPVKESGSSTPLDMNHNDFEFDVDARCVAPFIPEEGGLITHLIRYVLLRLKTCSNFCVLCDKPHLFSVSMVRPAVCSRAICVFAFHELAVGSDAADSIAADSDVVELLTVMFLAAANSARADAVLQPYPSLPDPGKSKLALDPDRPDHERVRKIASSFPPLSQLRSTTNYATLRDEVHKRDPLAFPLLGWIVSSNRSYIVKVPAQLSIKTLNTDDQFLLLTSTPEKDEIFRKRAKESGTFLAFHGSRGENWHSILRSGLKNYSGTKNQLNGATHGTGIYFGKDAGTSLGYSQAIGAMAKDAVSSKPAKSWPTDEGSMKWDTTVCVCVCEIVKGAEKDHGWCWTVTDEEAVMTRLFFVYRNQPTPPTVRYDEPTFIASVSSAMDFFRTFK